MPALNGNWTDYLTNVGLGEADDDLGEALDDDPSEADDDQDKFAEFDPVTLAATAYVANKVKENRVKQAKVSNRYGNAVKGQGKTEVNTQYGKVELPLMGQFMLVNEYKKDAGLIWNDMKQNTQALKDLLALQKSDTTRLEAEIRKLRKQNHRTQIVSMVVGLGSFILNAATRTHIA